MIDNNEWPCKIDHNDWLKKKMQFKFDPKAEKLLFEQDHDKSEFVRPMDSAQQEHDKTYKMACVSLLSTWRNYGYLASQRPHSKDICAMWSESLPGTHHLVGFVMLQHSDQAILWKWERNTFEPQHDKTNKMTVRPSKTQIGLGIRPVW